jgi:hypothetical protein
MTAASVRRVTIGVCAAGIAGMIVTSILDHNGAAVTFGLITAVSVLCSMVATTVERGRPGGTPGPGGGRSGGPAADPDALAPLVEAKVQDLVAAGADETSVRTLVGEAVRLGRSLRT